MLASSCYYTINSTKGIRVFLGLFPKPQVPRGDVKRASWHLHSQMSCPAGEKPELKEPKSFIKDSEHVCFLFQRETLFLCLKGCALSIFARIVQNKSAQCLCAQDAQKCEGSVGHCLPTPASATCYSVAMWDRAQSSYSLTKSHHSTLILNQLNSSQHENT